MGLHFYYISINCIITANHIAVFCQVTTNLYNSLMIIIIVSNDEGFKIVKYNIIISRQLGETLTICLFILFMK